MNVDVKTQRGHPIASCSKTFLRNLRISLKLFCVIYAFSVTINTQQNHTLNGDIQRNIKTPFL